MSHNPQIKDIQEVKILSNYQGEVIGLAIYKRKISKLTFFEIQLTLILNLSKEIVNLSKN